MDTLLRIAFGLVVVTYAVVSAVAMYEHGFVAIFAHVLDSSASAQVFLDLCVALFLVGGQMRKDARERGVLVWPFLVALPFLGSVSALAYIALRQIQRRAVDAPAAATPQVVGR